jgi:hypothetical protein
MVGRLLSKELGKDAEGRNCGVNSTNISVFISGGIFENHEILR